MEKPNNLHLKGKKFQPGEYKELANAIKAHDQTPAGRSLSTAKLTVLLNQRFPNMSRPISENVVTRIRSGKPAYEQNPAHVQHGTIDVSNISASDLIRINREFVEMRIPGIIERAEQSLEELAETLEIYSSNILCEKDPMEAVHKSSLPQILKDLLSKIVGTSAPVPQS